MTIVIKQDQVNMLVYKYLLESGLKHTAFSLFNEANLDKLDVNLQKVAPRMLVNYLEKALIFNQIETHIYKDEHIDCKGTFELLIPHQCKTTDLKKQELASKINQLHHDLEPILNEDDTNASIIHKVKMTNEKVPSQFNAIFPYNYEIDYSYGVITEARNDCVILHSGENEDHLSLWKIKLESETHRTILRPSKVIDFNCLECKKEDLVDFQWDPKATEEYLMVAFRDGRLYFFDSNSTFKYKRAHHDLGELKTLINVQPDFQKEGITWNPFSSDLVSIRYDDNYLIVNPIQAKVISNKAEKVKSIVWQNATNFATLTYDDTIYLYEADSEMSILSYTADENTEKMKFSPNALFLGSLSSKANCIKVWTMNSKNCLYSYMDNYIIKDFVWSSHEEGNKRSIKCLMLIGTPGFFNFIVIVFQHFIKLFDIEFGEIKCTIELDERYIIPSLNDLWIRIPIISTLLYNKDTYVALIQEDGTISIFSLFTNNINTKKLYYLPSSGEVKNIVKWGVSNALGISKNDLVIMKFKKVLP